MKGINTPGQALDPRHFVPPFRPKGRGISTLRSRHSLGNGTNKLVPLLSLRLGIKETFYDYSSFSSICSCLGGG
jgi:hypothetical protein